MSKIILLIATVFTFSQCSLHILSKSAPINHDEWTALVKKHVDADGLVDYKGFIKDKAELQKYLDKLSAHAPSKKWSDNDKIAYWLNAYNAFTVKDIVDNYPVKSIKDLGANNPIMFVNTAWDKKFFKIDGRSTSLNNIEHRILRQNFTEPRIHFALNCASMSCPKLRTEAYEGSKLDAQLTDQAKDFLADKHRNQITATNPKVSSIFDFYGMDMTKWSGMDLISYINKYAPVKIKEGTKLQYLDYDWSLNEQGKKFKD